MNKKRLSEGGLNRVWPIVLRNVAKGVTFYIHLWRNVLDMYIGDMNLYSLERWVVLVPGYLVPVLHRGIRSMSRCHRSKGGPVADRWELLTSTNG